MPKDNSLYSEALTSTYTEYTEAICAQSGYSTSFCHICVPPSGEKARKEHIHYFEGQTQKWHSTGQNLLISFKGEWDILFSEARICQLKLGVR